MCSPVGFRSRKYDEYSDFEWVLLAWIASGGWIVGWFTDAFACLGLCGLVVGGVMGYN